MIAPLRMEPVTQNQIDALVRTVGRIAALVSGLFEVDLSRGRGVGPGHERYLWTTAGNRITVSASAGGIIVSRSHEIDQAIAPSGEVAP